MFRFMFQVVQKDKKITKKRKWGYTEKDVVLWTKVLWHKGEDRSMGLMPIFSAHRFGGLKTLWVNAEYGDIQVWVSTESTVNL